MHDLVKAIPKVRDSIVSILKMCPLPVQNDENGNPLPQQYKAGMVGTAFCIVDDRYLLTAHHIFNEGKPRDPNDVFYAFVVPGNDAQAFHFPIISFPFELPDADMAVLEIGPCATQGTQIAALKVSVAPQPDGTPVLTVGFPAPKITQVSVDLQGNYAGGQFFLKSHANVGVVSAQYDFAGALMYELNVGWHHGESGGPIATLDKEPSVFSIMQHYRNVQSPHGPVAGPHRGRAIAEIQADLATLGAKIIQ